MKVFFLLLMSACLAVPSWAVAPVEDKNEATQSRSLVKHITVEVVSRSNEVLVTATTEYPLAGVVERDQRRDKLSWSGVRAQLRYQGNTLVGVTYF